MQFRVERSEGMQKWSRTPIKSRWIPEFRRYIHYYGRWDPDDELYEQGRDYFLWWLGWQFHLELG